MTTSRDTHQRDAAFDDWIDRARRVTVREELERRGIWSARMNGDAGVPCPGCGGRDRFAVNTRKNVFLCRASGAGGDAIALAQHIDGCDFLVACEILTGEPPPKGAGETPEDKCLREENVERRIAAENARRAKEAAEAEAYRTREIKRARDIWDRAAPLPGSIAETYLARRGIKAGPGARLRCRDKADLWDGDHQNIIHTGPALVAGITGPNGRFSGVAQIWIDLDQPKGKLLIADPKTGEFLPAKKMRGSHKGGSVLLVKPANDNGPKRLFLGEGIETVLSVYCALAAAHSPLLIDAEFRAALSLGNLSGIAAGRVAHPSLTKTDAKGRVRKLFVPNEVPKPAGEDWPMIGVPDSVEELILLGDGDSEPFATSLAMRRSAARFSRAYPCLTVRLAWSREGADFNDMWRAVEGVAA